MSGRVNRWQTRPRNVAIAAAAVAVMVCGAIWPMPIVGAGGALIAAFALYAGIRQMIAEHREAQHAAAVERAVARLRYLGEDQAADLLEAWARGEHPEHDPDESGPDPDSARTDPDPADPRATDQPGHDPDGLAPAQPNTPRCTATWPTHHYGTFTCWRPANHNADKPPLHAGESDRGWRFTWLDTDSNAKPHQAATRTEGSSR